MVSDVILFGLLELFFLISAILILRRLSKNKNAILLKILVLTCLVGAGIAVLLGGTILNLTNVYGGYTAQKQFAAWTMIWSGYMILTGPQVFFFRKPRVKRKSKVITNFSPDFKQKLNGLSATNPVESPIEMNKTQPTVRETNGIDLSLSENGDTPINSETTP